MRVHFSANTSPFAGREGRFVTSRQIDERLRREALGNVSITVEREPERPETFQVAGRGELQIGDPDRDDAPRGLRVRVSRPEIITREIDGQRCEPVEDVVVEVPEAAPGAVMEKLAQRRGRMVAMEQRGDRVRMHFVVPSRGLFGYRSEFLTDTRGEGVLHRTVRGYEPWAGDLPSRGVGAIVASEAGKTTAYALFSIQERSTLFVGAGVPGLRGPGRRREPPRAATST